MKTLSKFYSDRSHIKDNNCRAVQLRQEPNGSNVPKIDAKRKTLRGSLWPLLAYLFFNLNGGYLEAALSFSLETAG